MIGVIMKKTRLYQMITLMGVTVLLSGCSSGSPEKDNTITLEKSIHNNPITGFNENGTMIYGGDPAAMVDGDTVYLYTGHDTATGDSYVIPEWQCYSSTDMLNWTYEGVILSCKNISWADNNSAWASQAIKYKDKYNY